MEFKVEDGNEEVSEPVSPTGQYFNSSVLSICVLTVLESEIPIDDSMTMSLLKDVFLPINTRFSSIMVRDKDGVKQWKRVELNLKDHIHVPDFPDNLSPISYDKHLNDYLSKVANDQLSQTRPLWEIHILKYPTSNAAGNLIFKLHHALGDGFSLMGALLSCLQRADNPSLPLTFPPLQYPTKTLSFEDDRGLVWKVGKFFSLGFNTMIDFGWSVLKSKFVEDGKSMIRSGDEGVEYKPITVSTMTFPIEWIKEIKNKLGVSINDVMCGVIFLGTRLYIQAASYDDKLKNAESTALVLLNTRNIGGYKSVEEMVKPNTDSPWGNQFGFLHVSVPQSSDSDDSSSINPLPYVWNAHKLIQKKRNSMAVNLTGQLLEGFRKLRGAEATARYIHSTLKNSSMTISNLVGPVERMSLADHPIKGFYFMVVGIPQSLTITMVSYMGNMRVAVGTEKGFIDSQKFKASIENAFSMISEAAKGSNSFGNIVNAASKAKR